MNLLANVRLVPQLREILTLAQFIDLLWKGWWMPLPGDPAGCC